MQEMRSILGGRGSVARSRAIRFVKLRCVTFFELRNHSAGRAQGKRGFKQRRLQVRRNPAQRWNRGLLSQSGDRNPAFF